MKAPMTIEEANKEQEQEDEWNEIDSKKVSQ